MKLIAETAWHHEGDFNFMKNLINEIVKNTKAEIVKMHITLDFDEYMDTSHELYEKLKRMTFNQSQWQELAAIIKKSNKELMLLLNDSKAIEFGISLNPEYIEIHSLCLNDLFLLDKLKSHVSEDTKIVLGVGGTDLTEIENAIKYLNHSKMIIMFGFQNYPTIYEDVNLNKIRKLMKLLNNFEYGYADHTSWDSDHNELITLLGAAIGVNYVEKHVTTHLGEERIDSPAAISVKMLNHLHDKLKILETLNGNGLLDMNKAEKNYSKFGPMKKAAMLIHSLPKGSTLDKKDIKFIRTGEVSDLSQLDVINNFGKKINCDLIKGTILINKYFLE